MNMSEQKEKSFDRLEPLATLPKSLEEYKTLRAQLKRSQRNLMGKDLTNMNGYLTALEGYLEPVKSIVIYPVSIILQKLSWVRTWDATRYDLITKIDEFIVAIDREIKSMES